MEFPDDLKFTKEHEWVRVEGKYATIGVSAYAAEQMGDIVYVELPDEGEVITKHETFGVIESVKSASDIYAPVSGEVVEINEPLKESPEMVNDDCYGEGWVLKVEMSDTAELGDLMDSKAYAAFCKEEEV